MTIDPTTLPSCVYEDGSGGALPCHWDASVQGNGVGLSYVINADDTVTYDLAPASAPAFTEPVVEPVVEPVAQPVVEAVVEVAISPDQLAHTGADSTGWAVAVLMVTVGISLCVSARAARRRAVRA